MPTTDQAKVVKKPSKTAAELAAEKARQKIQAGKIKELAKKSHKERVAGYNEYLSKLSEHHDIPKVFTECRTGFNLILSCRSVQANNAHLFDVVLLIEYWYIRF